MKGKINFAHHFEASGQLHFTRKIVQMFRPIIVDPFAQRDRRK